MRDEPTSALSMRESRRRRRTAAVLSGQTPTRGRAPLLRVFSKLSLGSSRLQSKQKVCLPLKTHSGFRCLPVLCAQFTLKMCPGLMMPTCAARRLLNLEPLGVGGLALFYAVHDAPTSAHCLHNRGQKRLTSAYFSFLKAFIRFLKGSVTLSFAC